MAGPPVDRRSAEREQAEGTHSKDAAGASGARERLTARRALGLDRSGAPPPQTLAGAPLRPFTVPNAIGFIRLALIPVFLIVAFSSSDGTGAAPALLFALIGAGDYLDGIAARVSGQYSRLGTLMDPATDRLLVISAAAVCWHFQLLAHWALVVLAARELAMLALGRYAQTKRLQMRINWPGRIGVGLLFGSFVFAMLGLGTLGDVLLYLGLAFALGATALYVRAGLSEVRAA